LRDQPVGRQQRHPVEIDWQTRSSDNGSKNAGGLCRARHPEIAAASPRVSLTELLSYQREKPGTSKLTLAM